MKKYILQYFILLIVSCQSLAQTEFRFNYNPVDFAALNNTLQNNNFNPLNEDLFSYSCITTDRGEESRLGVRFGYNFLSIVSNENQIIRPNMLTNKIKFSAWGFSGGLEHLIIDSKKLKIYPSADFLLLFAKLKTTQNIPTDPTLNNFCKHNLLSINIKK